MKPDRVLVVDCTNKKKISITQQRSVIAVLTERANGGGNNEKLSYHDFPWKTINQRQINGPRNIIEYDQILPLIYRSDTFHIKLLFSKTVFKWIELKNHAHDM